jgi:capsular polysaccharide biosynthesis protein
MFLPPDVRVYVPQYLPWHREIMGLLGFDAARIIPCSKHRVVGADCLLAPAEANKRCATPSLIVNWLRYNLLTKASKSIATAKRIYVSRGNQPNTRRLINEAECMSVFRKHGFVRINPGELTVAEQIRVFASAETIIGLHGAGFANLVFVQPGTRVLEIFSRKFISTSSYNITTCIPDVKYNYLVDTDNIDECGGGGVQTDILLSSARLETAIERLLS